MLAFLSGGISSAVYAFDNIDNHDAVCSGFSTSELCDDLQTVYTSELAAAVSS